MVSYHTQEAMKKVEAVASTGSPAAIEITISWLPAPMLNDRPIQRTAAQAIHISPEQEEAVARMQHHHFRYASRKINEAHALAGHPLTDIAVNYGLLGEVHTIEFRSVIPLIIGGVPLCSAFTPIDLGRFVPNYAQVEIEVSVNGHKKTIVSFIYSASAPTHVDVTVTPIGTMEFSL